MRRLIQLAGISGVGKSSLLKLVRDYSFGISVIDFGEEYRAWSSQTKKTPLDGLPDQPCLRQFIDECIFKREPAIVSSHVVHYHNGRFMDDAEVEIYMDAAVYVVLVSDPEEIKGRRLKDWMEGVKRRPVQDIGIIQQHQELTITTTNEIAKVIGASVYVITNHEGKLQDTFEELRPIIEWIKWNR